MAKWHMHIACCVPEANTRSVYVLLIVFPLQQEFPQQASMLHYRCTAMVVVLLCISFKLVMQLHEFLIAVGCMMFGHHDLQTLCHVTACCWIS